MEVGESSVTLRHLNLESFYSVGGRCMNCDYGELGLYWRERNLSTSSPEILHGLACDRIGHGSDRRSKHILHFRVLV
jgi:hypothetical protein